MILKFADSRREARKAFLALSSDASQRLAGLDSLKPDVEDDGENPLNDVKSPHSTPVSLFPCWLINCITSLPKKGNHACQFGHSYEYQTNPT